VINIGKEKGFHKRGGNSSFTWSGRRPPRGKGGFSEGRALDHELIKGKKGWGVAEKRSESISTVRELKRRKSQIWEGAQGNRLGDGRGWQGKKGR